MKQCLHIFVLVLTLATIPETSFGKKTFDEVANLDALLKVQSFCVDMDKIETSAVPDVRKFLDKQNTHGGSARQAALETG